MSKIETMQVTYKGSPQGGLVTINKSDYDETLHSLPNAPKKRGRPAKKRDTE